jgi:hypothetical protein
MRQSAVGPGERKAERGRERRVYNTSDPETFSGARNSVPVINLIPAHMRGVLLVETIVTYPLCILFYSH